MTAVAYDVELITEESDPICWIAACAMAKSYGAKVSASVENLADQLDETDVGVDDLGDNWSSCNAYMGRWGLTATSVDDAATGGMTAAALADLLQGLGPVVLTHLCDGFPYGDQWADQSFLENEAHAVLLTGVDTDAATASFNNPWGDKDQSCDLDVLVTKIIADKDQGKTLAYWPKTETPANAADPSATDPPAADPPVADPPVADPPVADPPSADGGSTS